MKSGLKMPDITQAQALAAITFIISQAVAFGALDNTTAKVALSVAGTVIAAAWKIADAVIRNGRAQIAVAQVHAASIAPVPPPMPVSGAGQ